MRLGGGEYKTGGGWAAWCTLKPRRWLPNDYDKQNQLGSMQSPSGDLAGQNLIKFSFKKAWGRVVFLVSGV